MVNFSPTEDQELLRDTIRSFAREQLRPKAHDADERNEIPPDIATKGWDLGLVANSIPEEYGGYGNGRSAIRAALKLEELAYGDLSLAMHIVAPRLLTVPLILHGSEAQKRHWLPRFTEGDVVQGTAAFVEPSWTFDPGALETKAEKQGGDWVITGRKCLVPVASQAIAILVYAATPTGLGAFVVEPGAKGLVIGDREKNMGIKALETRRLELDGVRVPVDARLGGDGVDLQPMVDAMRVANAVLAVGVARAAFDYAVDYAKERHAFGVPIAQKQAIAFMLANMATEIDAMRLLAWEAAWLLDEGRPATAEAYMASNYAAQATLQIADDALQVLGGHGYIRDHPVELFLRNGRGFATFTGLAIV
jgi:acyl-CoA dehydrogenase